MNWMLARGRVSGTGGEPPGSAGKKVDERPKRTTEVIRSPACAARRASVVSRRNAYSRSVTLPEELRTRRSRSRAGSWRRAYSRPRSRMASEYRKTLAMRAEESTTPMVTISRRRRWPIARWATMRMTGARRLIAPPGAERTGEAGATKGGVRERRGACTLPPTEAWWAQSFHSCCAGVWRDGGCWR